jgi:NAD(P)-dependent dehydrogenase (short-subunit alcohol dehydrogenase family)
VSKAVNLGITKHITAEFGKYGIKCNAIAPGTIATQRNWDRLTAGQRVKLFLLFHLEELTILK